MNDKLDISELNITDEMVKEFLKNFSFGSTQLSNWEKFKQSKIYAKKERITVTHLWQHDTLKGNGNDAFWYQFCTSQPIEHIRNSKIKYAIEDVINPNKEKFRVNEDMICPITKEHCDDECCTVGSICNASNNEPQPVTEKPF